MNTLLPFGSHCRKWLTATHRGFQLIPRTCEPSADCSTSSQVVLILCEFFFCFVFCLQGFSSRILNLLFTVASPWQQRPVWCSSSRQMSVFLMMCLTCPTGGCYFGELSTCYIAVCDVRRSRINYWAAEPALSWCLIYFLAQSVGGGEKFDKSSFPPN